MRFTETALSGAFIVDLEPAADERGFFARSWCTEEFRRHGLSGRVAQCNVSFNRKAGTFRGMHFQAPPYQEAKLVRCTCGAIYDVIVDLRRDSPTFGRHFGVVLSAENRRMLYVPEDFAHGFITLVDNTEVFYQMSEVYSAECSRSFRWDDPSLGIDFPIEIAVISERDRNSPYLAMIL
ncbi:dTDP-4-dehydrorhamnose 3,5-epimerase [Thioalkalicoccus limnaeus]|uniref:dTDP-4-dehydrorhamnose 3,5-epimerase n=1 Tax=Thioalkalicoccus limnaeus TaxID=120681 RepID=A0ABV4BC32_9GAMM